MKPALVTGASGFVGWHVARRSLRNGATGCARWCAGAGSVRELDAEVVAGDLRDPESLERAVAGCGVVFHVAADYRLWASDPAEMYRPTWTGHGHCWTRRGGRVSSGSSTPARWAASGSRRRHWAMRRRPAAPGGHDGPLQAVEVPGRTGGAGGAAAGFPVVIVNPTAPVGDHDVKPTPTGKIIVDFLRGRMPAFVDTGLNVVDVRGRRPRATGWRASGAGPGSATFWAGRT